MWADISIRGAVVVASAALLALTLSPAIGAAEQPGTAGPAPQTDVTAMSSDKQSATDMSPVIVMEPTRKPQPIRKMQEWLRIPPEDDFSHLLNLDFHGQDEGAVARTREEDSKHAVSF